MTQQELNNSLQFIQSIINVDILPSVQNLSFLDTTAPELITSIIDSQTIITNKLNDISTTLTTINGAQGIQGIQGIQGVKGEGVPIGGLSGQVLKKIDEIDFNARWVDLPFTPIYNSLFLSSPLAFTSVTLADIVGLSFPLEANSVYSIDCFITFQSVATTTGFGLGFLAPLSSVCMLEVVVPIANTAVSSQLRTIFPTGGSSQNSGSVLGTGVSSINSNHTARISGIIRNGQYSGDFKLQARTEIALSAVTIQAGSELQIVRVG